MNTSPNSNISAADEAFVGLHSPEPYSDLPPELKTRDNWVNFRHEQAHGRMSNLPYRVDSPGHAKVNDPSTFSTFDDASTAASNPARNFDGISFMLQGTPYLGFDFDDVVHAGILEQYVASILRAMGDPYAEVSFSGTGLRVFVNCPDLPRPSKTLFKNAEYGVEIYHGAWAAKALTVTGNRYSGSAIPTITPVQFELIHVLCSQILDSKFKALWLGDTSAYSMDDNRADEALCCRLARLFNFDAEKMDAAFRWSALGRRDKWTRKDYRALTINKAITFVKSQDVQSNSKASGTELVFTLPAVVTTEANDSDYVLARILDQSHEDDDGWCPLGAVSLFGAPSGAGKTTTMYQLLLTQQCKGKFLGHESHGLPFCVMGVDRGAAAHRRTMRRMHMPVEAIPFEGLPSVFDKHAVQHIIENIEKYAAVHGVLPSIVLVEGVDMLVTKVNDIQCVTVFMDLLHQVAKHFHIALIGTLGSPKIKIGQGYAAKRDNLLGSSAWGRKCEAILNLQFPQQNDMDGRRRLFVILRNGNAEHFTLGFNHGLLEQVPDIEESEMDSASNEIEWFQTQARLAKTEPAKTWWTILDMERALTLSHSTAKRHVADEYTKHHIRRKTGKKVGKGAAAQYQWNESKENPIWAAQQKQDAAEQQGAF